MRSAKKARIIGVGTTILGKLNISASKLMQMALEKAIGQAGLSMRQLDGLIAIPSLAEPHFMEAHYLATQMGMLPRKDVLVRTIDTGGAGPVSGLIEAKRMIERDACDVVAVVAGDAVSSLTRDEFLRRADQSCSDPAEWQMNTYGLTREQLAMYSVLASRNAVKHPLALTKVPHTLAKVLESPAVASVTSTLECARRADGGAAIVMASSRFCERHNINRGVVILGGGEASGPLYPPPVIDEEMFSCEDAAEVAFEEAQLSVRDIDFWGLYDCFPICFIRAVEAVGLAKKGQGGRWVQDRYEESMNGTDQHRFPVNTHGGLLAFGAPWEVPAMYNIIEAVEQLTGTAGKRQINNARRALVYGNGGIFSASSVAILGNGRY